MRQMLALLPTNLGRVKGIPHCVIGCFTAVRLERNNVIAKPFELILKSCATSTFLVYTLSNDQTKIDELRLACKKYFDVIHAMVKEPNSKHHVQQPSANRQPPIVAVPFEQSDLIAVGSNGYPSFQDLKNINPLEPCHILYSTTNAPLLTTHTTRDRFMIANGLQHTNKNHIFQDPKPSSSS